MAKDRNDKAAGSVELGFLAQDISFVTRVLRSQIQARNAEMFERHGIAAGEVVVLNLIGLNAGISQNELAAAVVLKKSAVTKLVSDLETLGFVERRKTDADLRFNALHLTPAGEARRRMINAAAHEQSEALLAPLSATERQRLFALLGRLSDYLGAAGH